MNKFKLTIIGSGGMTPTKNRHPSCYLLEVGQKKIILDMGHTSIARLVEQGVDLHSIDALFISHFHTDHFGDALPFVHSIWVDDLVRRERNSKTLEIIGPKSIKKRWKKLREVFWVEPEEHYPIKFIEGPQAIFMNDIKIEVFEVKHVSWFQSVGAKISFQGKTFVYTGDIGSDHPINDLKKIIKNIDLLLIESGGSSPSPNHFTIDQIINASISSGVRKTIATHIRDENLPVLAEKIKNQNNIILAEDLMEVEI